MARHTFSSVEACCGGMLLNVGVEHDLSAEIVFCMCLGIRQVYSDLSSLPSEDVSRSACGFKIIATKPTSYACRKCMVRMNRIPSSPCRDLAWEELGRYFPGRQQERRSLCLRWFCCRGCFTRLTGRETLECGWTLPLRLPICSGSSSLQQAIHPHGVFVPVGI